MYIIKKRILGLILLCSFIGTNAQIPTLVTQKLDGIGNLTSFNGLLFFSTQPKDNSDNQLYYTDGTEEGTRRLKKITSNSWSWIGSRPDELIVINDRMFFEQYDSTNREKKLWVTDGTRNGTVIVKHFNTNNNWCMYQPVKFNDMLFFIIETEEYGYELWKSEGTEQTTVVVKDIYSGGNSSYPWNLMVTEKNLYFFAYDTIHGRELWKTDGTELGTVLVKDINVGINDSDTDVLDGYIAYDEILIFSANDGIHGAELWRTDGTTEGTKMIKDINKGAVKSMPSNFCFYNDHIFFSAADSSYIDSLTYPFELKYNTELYRSDGTSDGTFLVSDINQDAQVGSEVSNLMYCNGQLLFTAYDGGISGIELWTSNGTTAGTKLLKDIYVGTGSSLPDEFVSASNTIYFNARDNDHGCELWYTKGDESNTIMLTDIYPGSSNSNPKSLTIVDSVLYFTDKGGKLWKLNGIESTIHYSNYRLKINVFPIPFRDNLYIKIDGYKDKRVIINLYNYLGKRVLHKEYNNSNIIIIDNLMNFLPGMYLLETVIDNRKITKKVIKTN